MNSQEQVVRQAELVVEGAAWGVLAEAVIPLALMLWTVLVSD